jgi:single-stranded-DNA-specific exonuclease
MKGVIYLKEWQYQDISFKNHPENFYIRYFSRCFRIHPLLLKYLFSLGYQTRDAIVQFLFPSIDQLHDPFLLKDMKKALERISLAINNQEKIIIFGDYDADGQTSTALVYRALKSLGANVDFLVPLRSEGYGLKPTALDEVSTMDISLIITVDNGTSAHEAIEKANKLNIDVIVTDHHEILQGHPNCFAFISPKRDDQSYPFKYLAGVGVALKLVQALFMVRYGQDWGKYIWDYFDLAAIGTVADMMPLSGENRCLVALGIQMMNERPKPIIKKLLKHLTSKHVDSSTIGFGIGPLLNACGRISNPNISTRFLCDGDLTKEEVKQLIEINERRKSMTAEQFEEVEHLIKEQRLDDYDVMIVQGPFHEGIIGLLASRIAEKYLKPAIVINDAGKGSARSVQNTNFSIIKAIVDCKSYLISYGGHQAAAGLSIDLGMVNCLRKAIHLSATTQKRVNPKVCFQQKLPIFLFPTELMEQFHLLEPYGMGNPKPVFYSESWFSSCISLGSTNEHFLLRAQDHNVWAFRFGDACIRPFEKIKFLYTVNSPKKQDFLLVDVQREPAY